MSWRRGSGGDGGVSKRWAVLLCVGSFYLGLLFANSEKHIKDKLHVATP